MVGAMADWFAVDGAVPAPAGAADPAHGADPAPQGRAGSRTAGLRRGELPPGGDHPGAGGRRAGHPAGGDVGQRARARASGGAGGHGPRGHRAGQGAGPARRGVRRVGAGAALPGGADRPDPRPVRHRGGLATTCTTGWSTWRSRRCTGGCRPTRRPSPRCSASGHPGGRRRGSTRRSPPGCTPRRSAGSPTSAPTRTTTPGPRWTRCWPSSARTCCTRRRPRPGRRRSSCGCSSTRSSRRPGISLWQALRNALLKALRGPRRPAGRARLRARAGGAGDAAARRRPDAGEARRVAQRRRGLRGLAATAPS